MYILLVSSVYKSFSVLLKKNPQGSLISTYFPIGRGDNHKNKTTAKEGVSTFTVEDVGCLKK
ncbi:hypothetical protein A2415_04590 [candidate division WWE3 bacterium RIFOXYC1_FULL_39_7]|uniref:Uncharacterized protein n=1 Tax=candidate division WWE3 bacterium RIFOXYC1_FULL_39_7 TaxID=1802643 RepID=A0A1F4WFZ8_UNCKA|nr:MAG: hypothetical protein A2415_04590 [candidate division WWE3 bacterium RIFOXYC1_FULL_39_7]